MPEHVIAAERRWYAVAPDGQDHDLVIRVSAPYVDDGVWRAEVSLGVLEKRSHSIAGEDSWQALFLAMSFAATRVGHFAEDGWSFYWERGGERAAPEDLLNVS
jgi:hypothetical protein